MSVDPDGEFAFLIAGAFMGAWIGAMTTAITGGDFQDYGMNMLIGGIAGALSAGVGSALTSGTNAVISGGGFWNAAALAGSTGATSGLASGALGSAFNGGDFGDILGGGLSTAFTSGLTSAVTGGISGGLRALADNRDFWSGKKWITMEVKVGAGGSFADIERRITSLQEYQSITMPNGDIPLKTQTSFPDKVLQEKGCSFACKLMVDDYYGLNDPNGINSQWETAVKKGGGLGWSRQIRSLYAEAGYETRLMGIGGTNEQIISRMRRIMDANHLIQVYHINVEVGGPHTSLINEVRYLEDFSKVRIHLTDPASRSTILRRFKSIKGMFQLWPKN